MYKFIDTTQVSESALLPSEALKINGEYIENIVPGYRTLHVKGREALSPEIQTSETGISDGSRLKNRRFPARYITVAYQLTASTNEAFRSAFNALARVLDVTDAELIFADEPDKYFTGTISAIEEVEPGRNTVVGEFQFICADPFKYSVEEYEVEPTLDDGMAFVVDYNGTYKSFPTLEAEIHGEAGCGFVGFFNDNEKIIQLGDANEPEGEDIPVSQTLVNSSFSTWDSWNTSVQEQWIVNSDVVAADNYYKYTGSGGIVQSAPAVRPDEYYLTGTDFGTGSLYHGPTITRALPTDAAGETGATNFRFSYSQKMSIGHGKNDTNQRGAFRAHILDANGRVVAGVNIWKQNAGKKGVLRFFINNTTMQTLDFDLSYNNKYTGNDKYEGSKCTMKAVRTTTIEKSGSKITFNVAGIKKTFNVPAVADMVATHVSFTFARYKAQTPLMYNGIFWAKFVKDNCDTWADIPNKFSDNDVVVANCNDGEVYLNNAPTPALGALGNDWEGFYLQPGTNQIGTTYSEWVEDANAPTFKMRYREVFL